MLSSERSKSVDENKRRHILNPIHPSKSIDSALISPLLFSDSVENISDLRQQNFSKRLHHVKRLNILRFDSFKRAIASLSSKAQVAYQNKVRDRFLSGTIDDTVLISRNLPPLINRRYIDPRTVSRLIFISEAGGILGSISFIVGSFYFYPEYDDSMTFCNPYDCILIGALLFVLGSFFFFAGSVANFIKNDASSCSDMGLTVNATLYCSANFLFTVGSAFFCPKLAEHHIVIGSIGFDAEYIGLGCFIFGSLVFILAPMYDMYRAKKLRSSQQISYLSLSVEYIIAVMYIGGSLMYFVGSIYFIPELFERFAVTMFVVGSFCFLGACLSSPLANLYRYWKRKHIAESKKRPNKKESLDDTYRVTFHATVSPGDLFHSGSNVD